MNTLLKTESLEGGAVLLITLGGSKGNILTLALMNQLEQTLDDLYGDDALKLVVLRGEGGRFSFGASVEEHVKDQAPSMLQGFHRLCRKLVGFPVPIASLVEKQCLGGAFEVVLCSHFVFATADAVFGCPEIKLGVFPPVLAAIGAQRLGGPTMERLLLTGDSLDAQSGKNLGWVTEIFATNDPMSELRAWFTRNLAPLSAFALRQGAQVAREASGLLTAMGAPLDDAESRYVNELLSSHDANEGIDAFLARRKPEWKNR